MGRGVVGVGMVLLFAACAPERPAPRESEALQRSARILARLDQLEADLHDERAKTAVYGELEDRHGQASQIACQVTDEHVQEIHRLAAAQEQKRQERSHRRRAVAQARVRKRTASAIN